MTPTQKNSADTRSAAPGPVQVMIFGSGACAHRIRDNLAEKGVAARLTDGAALDRCRGFSGNFQLRLTRDHQVETTTVPAIVVAEESQVLPNYAAYGLTPGPDVMTISTLEAELDRPAADNRLAAGTTIVFLCGWQTDSHPAVARRMLERCFQLQAQAGFRTVFMTGNLKVAPDGSEALVQAAKQAGTLFLKFTRDYPTIQPSPNGPWTFDYRDELTRETFRLTAQRLVVDECPRPNRELTALTRELGIDRDGLGFAQSDNVRRLSNATNRRGIFVAGGSRAVMSAAEQAADADQVSLRVAAFLQGRDADSLPAAVIEQGRCARCLTCHRLCPHLAIEIGDHISVVAEACQSCGICAAACPARAIDMEGVHLAADLRRRLQQPREGENGLLPAPRIVVFGCTRSAGLRTPSHPRPPMPCQRGCSLSKCPAAERSPPPSAGAFEAGADGVMLCTCHTDNCQSEIGNLVARKRARCDPGPTVCGRVGKRPLARHHRWRPTWGNELTLMVKAFVEDIRYD